MEFTNQKQGEGSNSIPSSSRNDHKTINSQLGDVKNFDIDSDTIQEVPHDCSTNECELRESPRQRTEEINQDDYTEEIEQLVINSAREHYKPHEDIERSK